MHPRLPDSASRITRRDLPLLMGGLLLASGLPRPALARRRPKPKVVTKTFTNGVVITINDNGPSSAWPSDLQVSGFKQGKLREVDLLIRGITHGYPGDIDMLLQAPNGRKAKVWSDAGDIGSADLTDDSITLDDQAAAALPQSAGFSTGRYRPANHDSPDEGAPDPDFAAAGGPGDTTSVRLATFKGIDPNGTWRLWIADDFVQDAGTMARGWALRITAEVRR